MTTRLALEAQCVNVIMWIRNYCMPDAGKDQLHAALATFLLMQASDGAEKRMADRNTGRNRKRKLSSFLL